VSILIVGFSTRAIAESAMRDEYDVVTLDYFGDRDQKELVENYSLMRDFRLNFSAKVLLIASRSLKFRAVVYTSSLENHPDVVEELARGRTLLGNAPATLHRVRDWGHLRSVCWQENIAHPVTLLPGEEEQARGSGRWMSKPVRSGGGHGICFWKGGALGKGRFLQKWIEGEACSAAFVSDGRRCVLLGLTEQLVGQRELGAQGFTWCGNILPPALSPQRTVSVLNVIEDTALRLTRCFGLRGVNGFDFVLARSGGDLIPYLVEVNPRYTASMELMEWAYGLNIFDLHVRSFEGRLPSFSLRENIHRPGFCGKGIVYATEEVVMPETAGWREKGRRDIPFPGERIQAGHPICTILAQGESRAECWHRLVRAADGLREEIGQGVRSGDFSRSLLTMDD